MNFYFQFLCKSFTISNINIFDYLIKFNFETFENLDILIIALNIYANTNCFKKLSYYFISYY